MSSARHISTSGRVLSLSDLTGALHLPVLVGNTVSGEAAYQLMQQGAAAILVGVGPGAACTTREVLGIGVPQVSATLEVAAARDRFAAETGPLRPGHHRRRHEDRRRHRQGDRLRSRCGDARLAVRRRARGAGSGLQLGHGGAVADPATRYADHHWRAACRSSRSCSARPRTTHGTQNLVGALRQSMAALGARHHRRDAPGRDGDRPVDRRPRASPGSSAGRE